MSIPDEITVRAAFVALIEANVAELVGKISGPVDAQPGELQAYIYYGPHRVEFDMMEVVTTIVTIQICTPAGTGNYDADHAKIQAAAIAVFEAIKTGMSNEIGGLIVTGPVTISPTGIGIFRPTGLDVVSASVAFSAEHKGDY